MAGADSQPERGRPRKKRRLVKAGSRARQEAVTAMPRPEELGEDANIAAIMSAEMDAQYEHDSQDEVWTLCLLHVMHSTCWKHADVQKPACRPQVPLQRQGGKVVDSSQVNSYIDLTWQLAAWAFVAGTDQPVCLAETANDNSRVGFCFPHVLQQWSPLCCLQPALPDIMCCCAGAAGGGERWSCI